MKDCGFECMQVLTHPRDTLPIGLFLDDGNYQIFPKEKTDGHNALFTNTFRSVKETIDIAG